MIQPPLANKGRGSASNPANRFLAVRLEVDDSVLDQLELPGEELTPRPKTAYFVDQAQSVVTENDSPDIPFRYSINPYRGCMHGCAYCYARPYHEYLGLSAGLDFETKILVKLDAVDRFEEWLRRPSWRADPIALSGVTDCYQPAERVYRLTRGILETALAYRQPLMLITKNALITRDTDILTQLAQLDLVSVAISITTLDETLARLLEPRTSAPQARLRGIETLSAAGVPVHIMMAPIIPALTDSEIPAVLERAAAAGASGAGHTLLRLPGAVRTVFQEWLQTHRPHGKEGIIQRLRSTHRGELNSSTFGARMRGSGPAAEIINQTFALFARKFHLDGPRPSLRTDRFHVPGRMRQQSLF